MSFPEPLPAAVAGLGPIGLATLRALIEDPGFVPAGVLEFRRERREPAWLEQADPRAAPLFACAEVEELAEGCRPAVAFVTTGSRAAEVAPLVAALLERSVSVVASCEELAEPRLHPREHLLLSRSAAAGGARFVATGVNPGFVLDYLPAVLLTAVGGWSVIAERRVDSLTRRPQLRAKTGAGLDPARFAREVRGHVGLKESAALVLRALGHHRLDAIEESLEPVLAERDIQSPEGGIARGQAAGVRQVARATALGREVVRLELVIAAGTERPEDRVEVDGKNPVKLVIPGGLHGESATVTRMLNAARPLLSRAPGVYTVLDLPPLG